MSSEMPKIEKPEKKENKIPPQYENLPSEIVEELWAKKLYVDPEKNESEDLRRKEAIQEIKDKEKANKIREKMGIPAQDIDDKGLSQQEKERAEEEGNFDSRIKDEYRKYSREYHLKIRNVSEQEADRIIDYSLENLDTTTLTKGLLQHMYSSIRMHDYKQDENYDSEIEEITKASTDEINSHSENGWHYRAPYYEKNGKKDTKFNKSDSRISLNVNADKKLIEDLDKCIVEICKKPGSVYYKTPEDSSRWLERHDPITIYFDDEVPDEVKEKIVDVTKPYIRSEEDVLPGEKLSGGVACERTPSEEKLQELVENGYSINKESGDAIREYLTKEDRLKASAGEVATIEKYIINFKKKKT